MSDQDADTVCEWGGCSEPLYRGSRYCREHTTQILNPPQDAESVVPRMWYVICCRECDGDGEPLLIPFETPEARGRWASEHKRGTGHDRWLVVDQPREHSDGEA